MIFRFHAFIVALVILLQLFASRYASLNDLAVYGAALEAGGVYEGDYSFELLQYGLKMLLSPELVIYGMQVTLLVLVSTYVYVLRRKINGAMYLVAFLIFTSPVVLVGLTNSIRQSLAFILVMLAFELRKLIWQLALLTVAILIHKASLLLIPILILMFGVKNWRFVSLTINHLRWILFGIFFGLVFSALYIEYIIDLLYSVYDRYSIYIYSAVVFTEGRVGGEKLAIWTIFWSAALLLPAITNSGRIVSIYLIVPLFYTLLLAIDANLRGFDEFHSRLLMFNNVFVLAWLIESATSRNKEFFCYFFVLIFNFFNPATIGVLI